MYYLRLLGGLSLDGPSGPVAGRAAQRRQLAILAILGAAGHRGCSRDKLIGYLWPDSTESQARHILADAVYLLRKALGEDSLLSPADSLRLNSECVQTDLEALERALAADDLPAAAEAYAGPFLDGFYLNGAREFEQWMDGERQRLAREFAKALETLAERDSEAGEFPKAVEWWERLAAHDPLNSRIAIQLVEALVAAGEPAHAVQRAREHADFLKAELGIEPPADVLELVSRLRKTGSGRFADTKPYRAVARVADAMLFRSVEGAEERYSVGEVFRIGRERGDLVVHDDPFLSSSHAEVRRQGEEYLLSDLDSLNGTFVRIHNVTRLALGDCIMVGSQILQLRPAPAMPGATLVRIDGGVEVESYELPPGQTGIGRTDGAVRFPDDPLMGDRHAEITVGADEDVEDRAGAMAITVRVSDPTEAVYVQISGERPLGNGDAFAAGQQVFRFERTATGP